MCTPSLAIDAIIEVWNDEEFDKIQPPASSKDSVVSQSHHPSYAVLPSSTVSVLNNSKRNVSIILVRRKDPPRDKFAITGGFVDVGETVEAATVREVKEETNLQVVHLEQFHVYSDPTRDARRHTVSSVFRCLIKYSDVLKSLKKGSDAKAVVVFPLNREILDLNLAFDHRTILRDYIIKYHPHLLA
jgi:8-oxo-dGTP diphosphatase